MFGFSIYRFDYQQYIAHFCKQTKQVSIGYQQDSSMIPSRYNRNQVRKCPLCGFVHLNSIPCQKMKCFYCQEIHNIKDFKEGMCPYVYYSNPSFRLKNMLVCPDCRGLGKYKQIQHVTIEESQTMYKQRIQNWIKYQKQRQQDEPQPQKMKFQTKMIEKDVTCTLCQGQGLVKPYKFCCLSGCTECSFQGTKPNSVWSRLKMESKKKEVAVQKETQCTICLETVPVNEQTYYMECTHRFHKKCILEHFSLQGNTKSCPNCRKLQHYYPYGNKPLNVILSQAENSSSVKIFNEENVLTKYMRSRSRDKPIKKSQRSRNQQESDDERFIKKERNQNQITTLKSILYRHPSTSNTSFYKRND